MASGSSEKIGWPRDFLYMRRSSAHFLIPPGLDSSLQPPFRGEQRPVEYRMSSCASIDGLYNKGPSSGSGIDRLLGSKDTF